MIKINDDSRPLVTIDAHIEHIRMQSLRRIVGAARPHGRRYGGMAAVVFALKLVACNGNDNDTRPPSGDDSSAPIITRDSYTALVAHVFDIYVGDLYNHPLLNIISLQPLSILLVNIEQRDGVYYGSYDCKSGHADSEITPSGTNYGKLFVYQFDACLDTGVLRNGTVNGRHGGYTSDIRTDDLTLQIHPELVTRFSGSATIQYSDSRIGPLHAWRLLLDADTGVPDTVRITIDSDDGTDVFETSWLPWQHLLRFDRYPGDKLAWLDPASHANPDPDAGPSITPSNYEALLDEVFDVFSERDTLAPLVIAQDFLSSNEPVQTIRERGVRRDRFDCPGDGAMSARRIDDDTSAYPQDFRLAFTGCEADEGGGAPLTQIVIDNRDERHESIEPWTSWRAHLPDARTRVCGNGDQ